MIERIVVSPKDRLRDLALPVEWAIISITDPPPDGSPAFIPQRSGLLRGVLRLSFCDFDPMGLHRSRRRMMIQSQGKPLWKCVIQKKDARKVWKFIQDVWLPAHTLVIHCEAGISRSPSMAMAIADCLAMGRRVIEQPADADLDPTRDPPNGTVYERVKRAFPKITGFDLMGWVKQGAGQA